MKIICKQLPYHQNLNHRSHMGYRNNSQRPVKLLTTCASQAFFAQIFSTQQHNQQQQVLQKQSLKKLRQQICNVHILRCRRPQQMQHTYMRADIGSGTVVGIGLVIAVALLLVMILTVALAMRSGSIGRTAADQAALAAAQTHIDQRGDPCANANEIAQRNRAELTACQLEGDDVTVTVRVATGVPIVDYVTVSAKAGPQPCDGE